MPLSMKNKIKYHTQRSHFSPKNSKKLDKKEWVGGMTHKILFIKKYKIQIWKLMVFLKEKWIEVNNQTT